MSKIKELLELAEDVSKHFGEEWDSALVGGASGNYHAIICEDLEIEVARTEDDRRENSWLCDYLEAVDPQSIKEIAAEMKAKDKLISEMEDRVKELEEDNSTLRQERAGLAREANAFETELQRIREAVPEPFRVFRQAGGVDVAVKDGIGTKNHLYGLGYNAALQEILRIIEGKKDE